LGLILGRISLLEALGLLGHWNLKLTFRNYSLLWDEVKVGFQVNYGTLSIHKRFLFLKEEPGLTLLFRGGIKGRIIIWCIPHYYPNFHANLGGLNVGGRKN